MVYLLEPKPYKWIRAAKVSQELMRKQIEGIALQQSDIPTHLELKGRVGLPDICSGAEGFLFVSDRGRLALEELAPGCVAFFPLNLVAPSNILTGSAYFFIEVLPRAQLIDWDLSPTTPRIERTLDGRESRALKAPIRDPSVKFKVVTSDTPQIWRETDVNRPDVHFFRSKKDIFMRDELWDSLNAKFPKQLVARKLA